MEGMFISVKTDKYEIEVPLNGRITYLRGDSGAGKTTFAQLVLSSITDGEDWIKVSTPEGYSPDVLNSTKLIEDIEARPNSIIIIDDNLGTEKANFPKVVSNILRDIDSYIIIINRVDVLYDSLSSDMSNSFEYSALCALWVEKKSNNIKRVVKPLINCLEPISGYTKVSDILCEDSYGMYTFCKSYNIRKEINIHTSNGKGNIVPLLRELEYKGDVFLYVDLISFGQKINDVYTISMIKGVNVIIDYDFLSFEYFVLKSNYFRNNIDIPYGPDITEKSYEILLEKISKSQMGYACKHMRPVPICLLKDCSECQRYPSHCNKTISEDKLYFMVSKTEFEYMLKLLRG